MKQPMTREVGRKLNKLFRVLGTWEAVAKKVGVTSRSIRRYWQGTRTPDPRRLLGLA